MLLVVLNSHSLTVAPSIYSNHLMPPLNQLISDGFIYPGFDHDSPRVGFSRVEGRWKMYRMQGGERQRLLEAHIEFYMVEEELEGPLFLGSPPGVPKAINGL
ncbi:MAG: hypothetical protein CM1200mP35_10270 [Chloroflexota bacterium]|nr:MAG: hypothetical protein CM1200mP35_10270 [Chloroflexota bacterium]